MIFIRNKTRLFEIPKNIAVPSEHLEQTAFCSWMNVNYPDIFFYAVPNGEHRHPSVALRLKLEGVAKGVPDLVFPCARNGYHGLYIEMKRKKNSRVSTDQKKVIEILESYGNKVLVCKGAEEAQKAILEYFG